jgi:competence protein ComEA
VNKRVLFTGAVVALAGAAAVIRSSHTGQQQPPLQISSVPRAAEPSQAPARRVVYVAGAVARPGVYEVPPGARVESALRAAGGALPGADLEAVNLARPLEDGEEIAVPRPGEPVRASSAEGDPGEGGRRHRRHRRRAAGERASTRRQEKEPPAEPVDVNAASAEELETLPGIGPSLAERIVTFRETNGPFGSAGDLLDVNGMNDRRLEEIAPYIRAGR